MKYKGNVYSYFNLSGILFCIFIAWASYYNYKNLQITGLLAFFVFCVLKCAMLAKFKKDILEKDTPLLFTHGCISAFYYAIGNLDKSFLYL